MSDIEIKKSKTKFFKPKLTEIFKATKVDVTTKIMTPIGILTVEPGNYIITNPMGQMFPCSQENVEELFDEVSVEEAYDENSIVYHGLCASVSIQTSENTSTLISSDLLKPSRDELLGTKNNLGKIPFHNQHNK